MHRTTKVALVLSMLAALAFAATATAASGEDASSGAVYTLTNSAGGNAVAVFARSAAGTLSPQGSVSTGGLGTGSNLGSQGAVVLSDNGRRLFAVNAGSNTISELAVTPRGLQLVATVASGGVRPISVTVGGMLLYVLNAGNAGNIAGFVLDGDAILPLAGSTQPLGTGSSGPAQIQFTPDGSRLVVTEKASSTIDTYAVGSDGRAGAPVVSHAAGSTPFGFDFDNRGHLLTSDAGGTASSYALADDGTATPITGAVATHQGAPCWLIATKNGRYAYTANAGSGTISGFAVGHDGSLSLLDPSGVTASLGAGSHPLDEIVSHNGRYLYNLTDGRHELSAFRIEDDGSLTALGAVGTLPAGTVGLAAQ